MKDIKENNLSQIIKSQKELNWINLVGVEVNVFSAEWVLQYQRSKDAVFHTQCYEEQFDIRGK